MNGSTACLANKLAFIHTEHIGILLFWRLLEKNSTLQKAVQTKTSLKLMWSPQRCDIGQYWRNDFGIGPKKYWQPIPNPSQFTGSDVQRVAHPTRRMMMFKTDPNRKQNKPCKANIIDQMLVDHREIWINRFFRE